MSNPTNELVQRYIQTWNERDGDRRRTAIAATLTEDSLYTDPDWEAVIGHDAIDALIVQAQEKFGGLAFSVGNVINAHHDLVLFTWHLGQPGASTPAATGYNVAVLDKGLIHRVYGFFS